VVLDQPAGRLLSHARHTGDVVRRIPLEGYVVEVLLGREPEPGLHRGLVVVDDVGDPLPVEHHPDPGTDQLEEITVGGDDHRLHPLLHRPEGQGGDGVVGLVALDLHDGDLQRPQHLADQPELLPELVGRLRAAGLVVGVHGQPLHGRSLVERHRDPVRLLLGQELDQHRGEPVHGVGDLAGGRGQVRGKGEIRPVGQAVAVEEEEALRHHARTRL
jgi:hypothetical protein